MDDEFGIDTDPPPVFQLRTQDKNRVVRFNWRAKTYDFAFYISGFNFDSDGFTDLTPMPLSFSRNAATPLPDDVFPRHLITHTATLSNITDGLASPNTWSSGDVLLGQMDEFIGVTDFTCRIFVRVKWDAYKWHAQLHHEHYFLPAASIDAWVEFDQYGGSDDGEYVANFPFFTTGTPLQPELLTLLGTSEINFANEDPLQPGGGSIGTMTLRKYVITDPDRGRYSDFNLSITPRIVQRWGVNP